MKLSPVTSRATFLCTLSLLFLGGCAHDVAESVPDAERGSAQDVPAAKQAEPRSPGVEVNGEPSAIIDAPPLRTSPSASDPTAPWEIAHLKVGKTDVHFMHVTTVDVDAAEGAPQLVDSVIMRTKSVIDEPNPVDRLREQFDVPLTFAEIYIGLSGDRASLPPALAASHEQQAKGLGRTVALLEPKLVAEELDKQSGTQLLATFTGRFAPFTPAIPGHRWYYPFKYDAWFCPGEGGSMPGNPPDTRCPITGTIRTKFACAPRAAPELIYNGVPSFSSCNLMAAGWLRQGVQNFTTAAGGGGGTGTTNYPFTAQEYYGPIVGQQWGYFPAFIVNRQEYYVDDWDVPQRKKMATVVSRAQQGYGVSTLFTGQVGQ
jgi:hypothetical protein